MNLRDSQLGFGVQPSFPTFSWAIRIPIDHCLVSPEVVVLDRKLAPSVGSDHFPVMVELALKP
jgi:endonuclease/exonuclease/phosphatase (EEP) superfamily protein YafD